ncbi:biotin transporter BioY [Butyrivibrio fibrisolvens]|jgi:biotin transport system substrate-specific component|uniref:Biotin transporter n=1 Tax=Butyrivibrio fibrisolvens TaxID=831 RepID=A0A1H9QME3_BUTFI|nr:MULTISPECIES: biotin transporter BioY [Butyrivibrio]MBQ1458564.1 biotin transporter BioY [Butyrivibrio sp.]SER61741.1 biotin transport system substrate-specific component [Butyrivibrio fibrisolvens]
MKKFTVKTIVLCAMFAALCCATAPISIPLPGGVPITLQTAAVFLAALLLGPLYGFVAVLVYVLLGAVGLPVFAGFSGGIGSLVGMSGGFIMSWPFAALLAGFIYFKFGRNKKGVVKYAEMIVAMLLGSVVIYVVGLTQFIFLTKMSIQASLLACMVPFIPGDLLKMVLVAIIVPVLEKAMKSIFADELASANA